MIAPGTAQSILVGIVLDNAVVEDIKLAIGSDSSAVALLVDNLHAFEESLTVTAEVVDGTVHLTAFEVVETAYFMRVVGILIRQVTYVLVDGLGTLIM